MNFIQDSFQQQNGKKLDILTCLCETPTSLVKTLQDVAASLVGRITLAIKFFSTSKTERSPEKEWLRSLDNASV